jgi:hypothetical protein
MHAHVLAQTAGSAANSRHPRPTRYSAISSNPSGSSAHAFAVLYTVASRRSAVKRQLPSPLTHAHEATKEATRRKTRLR